MSTKGELYFPINTEITNSAENKTYVLKKIIGRGAYAQCFLAMVGQQPYALKIIKLADVKTERVREKLQTEIAIHKTLTHPNIVKMHTSFQNSEWVFIVLELCERGALDDLLKRNKRIKERYVSKFTSQLVNGLSYLHDKMSVVHRDLKLGNIFLDDMLNIKIGDFGLSAIINGDEKRKTVCGTPNYIAPEILFGKASGHSFEADVWSLGVIIYTLLVGTPPFQQKKVEDIYRLIERNQYIFPADCVLSSEAIDLITRLLTTNPNERPTLQEIAAHRFLTHRENLAFRVYKNLINKTYRIEKIMQDHVIFSTPINAIRGIGYSLSSGVSGIFYYDLTNVYFKTASMVCTKIKLEGDKKIFVTEEHLIERIPSVLNHHREHILYYRNSYCQHISSVFLEGKENLTNTAGNINFITNTAGNINFTQAQEGAFVAKVKKIKDGLLFIMANNVFVFDFNFGT
ncbi:polo-like kinase 1, partial [Enteropsectra breve]